MTPSRLAPLLPAGLALGVFAPTLGFALPPRWRPALERIAR